VTGGILEFYLGNSLSTIAIATTKGANIVFK
jgi:hypothetical protein